MAVEQQPVSAVYSLVLRNELQIITYMAYFMLVCALAALTRQLLRPKAAPAPYGRYGSERFGMLVNAKFAWFVQELPSFVIPFLLVFFSEAKQLTNVANLVCVGMMIVHYFQRTFVFSLLSKGKPTPMAPFIAAILYCCYNGYMQGRYQTQYAEYDDNWVYSSAFIIGCTMFVTGLVINIHADYILRNLRKPGETGYKIPRGGMFNYISGANFFGESVEWTGYALASWNLPAFAFAVFTVSNIGPRALHHHRYYKEKFDDYPPERKALIPFLL